MTLLFTWYAIDNSNFGVDKPYRRISFNKHLWLFNLLYFGYMYFKSLTPAVSRSKHLRLVSSCTRMNIWLSQRIAHAGQNNTGIAPYMLFNCSEATGREANVLVPGSTWHSDEHKTSWEEERYWKSQSDFHSDFARNSVKKIETKVAILKTKQTFIKQSHSYRSM